MNVTKIDGHVQFIYPQKQNVGDTADMEQNNG